MVGSKSLMRQRQHSVLEDELSDTLTRKTRELFYMCDPSHKGYVTKDELYHLKEELGLDDQEIENAFEQLDTDHNRCLTIEEFTRGFGLFLGLEAAPVESISDEEIKPDFVFQVFNLIDKDDKGYITREDFLDSADTLEIEYSQIDNLVNKLRKTSEHIQFEEFAHDIATVIAYSPALQEIKENEEHERSVEVKRQLLMEVFNMDVSTQTASDIDRLLYEQASLFFKLCDSNNKNYVTREDLLTLSQELTLSHDHLMETFSYLDTKGHGYLTLREFANGFGTFLGFEIGNNSRGNGNKYKEAKELFDLCDYDRKGYVTKEDLNCLINKIGLPEQQILEIFQQLDTDENGTISFQEFMSGFMNFPVDGTPNNRTNINNTNDSNNNESIDGIDQGNDEIVENVFEETYLIDSRPMTNGQSPRVPNGTSSCGSTRNEYPSLSLTRQQSMKYENTTEVNEMLEKMEEEVGSSLSMSQLEAIRDTVCSNGDVITAQMFETFLGKVYSELKSAKEETRHLEGVLERKSLLHNAEIKKIYEDMEQQMQNEKLKILAQENRRESVKFDDIQNDLAEKQAQLDKYMQRQAQLERRLEMIKEKEQQLKEENSELLKENVMLENKLNTSYDSMEALKSNLHRLEEKTSLEKKRTLRAAVQATQGLQSEHENLVRELEVLRTTNERLRDDRDTLESTLKMKVDRTPSWADELNKVKKKKVHRTGSSLGKYVMNSNENGQLSKSPTARSLENLHFPDKGFPLNRPPSSSTPIHKPLKKQGSIMSAYFETMSDHVHSPIELDVPDGDQIDYVQGISVDETPPCLATIGEVDVIDMDPLQTSNVIDCNTSSHNTLSLQRTSLSTLSSNETTSLLPTTGPTTQNSTPSSPRHAPVGMSKEEDNVSDSATTDSQSVALEQPSRIYKVVFVGDSNVGKSSFIHRFCFDQFISTFSATIGVDFQVQTMRVSHETIALQLWDTAGQERFRSITKNYFRRADGVVVMFDLSSEASYLNVKGWMLNIEECAETDVTVMMVGNKLDLVEEDEESRKIPYKTASRLAEDYNALYCEVSACSGVGVKGSLEKLSKRMLLNEDSQMKYSVLNLNATNATKKKGCCNR